MNIAKTADATKTWLRIIKIACIPVCILLAFFLGAYVGYQFMTDTSGANIFKIETWRSFIEQIGSLR